LRSLLGRSMRGHETVQWGCRLRRSPDKAAYGVLLHGFSTTPKLPIARSYYCFGSSVYELGTRKLYCAGCNLPYMGVVTARFTYKFHKLLLGRELGCVQIFVICVTIARRSVPHTYSGQIHLLSGDVCITINGRGMAGSSVCELKARLSDYIN
jgi:hypothetical protein